MGWIVGIDVGGTFTDIVLFDPTTGEVRITKVATARNQADSLVSGLLSLTELGDVEAIVHGTTVGTNAVIERNGAKAALVTTAGFRDVLELGRRTRQGTFGLRGTFEPLIPRELRVEVTERMTSDGIAHSELDTKELRERIEYLKSEGVESVAVVFLHSYANNAHEEAAGSLIRTWWPNEHVTLSNRILPEAGEFERTSTTAINAYLQPLLSRYISRIIDKLEGSNYSRPFRVMQSNGGALTASTAISNACRSVLSGPAGGVVAATWIGRRSAKRNLISADMGGTSFDVGLIIDGDPTLTTQKEISYGVPLRIPMVNVETIGAGGGSIVWIDPAGLLHVGPKSAGSNPGPICYGRGGTVPTLTDANAILGRIDIAAILPGESPNLAEARLAFEVLGRQMALEPEAAAEAAIRIADMNMANAIRHMTLEKGMDPRKFALLPFGGAGPLHAASIADELGITEIVVPPWPGVTSALGCVLADVRHDEVWTVHRYLRDVTADHLDDLYSNMRERIHQVMANDGIASGDVHFRYEAALQYEGQTHTSIVELDPLAPLADQMLQRFEQIYRERHTISVGDVPIRLVSLRLRGWASRTRGHEPMLPTGSDGSVEQAKIGSIRMHFRGQWEQSHAFDRWLLPEGGRIEGPARIQQSDTTTIIPPGWWGEAEGGNLILRPLEA